jgi:predicted protein tyrosine phosphatase
MSNTELLALAEDILWKFRAADKEAQAIIEGRKGDLSPGMEETILREPLQVASRAIVRLASPARILITDQQTAEEWTLTENDAVISIKSPRLDGLKVEAKLEGAAKVLRLWVDDVLPLPINIEHQRTQEWGRKAIIFGYPEAYQVLTFARKWFEDLDPLKTLIVHCEAGVSRSAGVAAALDLIINGSISCLSRQHRPNSHIKSVILATAGIVPRNSQ